MKLFKLTAAVAITFLATGFVNGNGNVAFATHWYSTGNDTDWFDSDSWNDQADGMGNSGVPAADDDVTVLNGDQIIVANETASIDTVTVENGATLTLESVGGGSPTTGILVVEESVTVGSTSGVFRFNESTDATPILRANDGSSANPVTLDGTFTVPGSKGAIFEASDTNEFHLQSGSITSSSGAVIISAPFENDGTINASVGNILISAALDNDGTVQATGAAIAFSADVDNAGTITAAGSADGDDVTFLASSSTINASSTGLFQVTAANSEMIFNMSSSASITGSGADFYVSAGLMHFKQSLSTANGGFKQAGGKVMADAGISFSASAAYSH